MFVCFVVRFKFPGWFLISILFWRLKVVSCFRYVKPLFEDKVFFIETSAYCLMSHLFIGRDIQLIKVPQIRKSNSRKVTSIIYRWNTVNSYCDPWYGFLKRKKHGVLFRRQVLTSVRDTLSTIVRILVYIICKWCPALIIICQIIFTRYIPQIYVWKKKRCHATSSLDNTMARPSIILMEIWLTVFVISDLIKTRKQSVNCVYSSTAKSIDFELLFLFMGKVSNKGVYN